MVLISGVLLLGLVKLDGVIRDQKQGRSDALGVSCAISGAVIEAGRTAISGGALPLKPDRLERNLRALGLPSVKVRAAGAKLAATRYARSIANAVQREVHVSGIVRKDGSIDCALLRQVARVGSG
jgi:hypothetical protein